ncbi:MAG: hypothetical protein HFG18_10940 [Oscillospiraceae bacterium]|nr:hypothetical protein [Oscillospiraceae bacterium]MCI9363124.1 hypothetical protein [Oscillospiraceae bacterium]RKJ58697.1 hypothetical protein D7X25_01755 [bacterium 1XD42-8]RKJ67577.1 hypothetical protein D7Y09_00215 [bacterium 1XD42-1]
MMLKQNVKKLVSLMAMCVMSVGMASSAFASTTVNLHWTQNTLPHIDESTVETATPTEHTEIEPRINSRGEFYFVYNLPAGNKPGDPFLVSDTFKVKGPFRINMAVDADDDELSGHKMYLTLFGKGYGIFGKRISWIADGKEYGYTFDKAVAGQPYYFELESDFYCRGDGDITNFDEVVEK